MKKSRVLSTGIICTVLALMTSCVGNDDSEELITGAAKRKQKIQQYVSGTASTIYTVPAMDHVQVKVNAEYAQDRFMDIYYPPGYDFSSSLPAIVIVNGLNGMDSKNLGHIVDWSLLMSANGMIAVSYNTLYPDKDAGLLLDYLVDEAESLGIDPNRLGIFGSCGNCCLGTNLMKTKDAEFYDGLKTGVFLYGLTPWSDHFNPETSVLLVNTGRGITSDITESMLSFRDSAEQFGMRTEYLDYTDGYKYFDVTENPRQPWEYSVDSRFAADCDTMKEILSFMKRTLFAGSGVS